MRISLGTLFLALAAAVGGCTMAPAYEQPAAPVPAAWPSGPAYAAGQSGAAASDLAQLTWQEFLLDEKLERVVGGALQNNRDLRLAALNVERAQALYGLQRAELLPVFNAGAGYSRQRVPSELSGMGQPITFDRYGANVFLNAWEIDLFGRIRSLSDRARADYLATEQARRGVQVLLIAKVAAAYLVLAADRETLKLAETTLESQLAAYDLVKRRFDRGLIPELDLHRAQTQVDTARVDVWRWTQLVARDRNGLDLLAGAPVPDELLPAEQGGARPFQELSAGLSSELLLRRPDIVQAEEMLRAANANIGAARAAFFPTISLTGAFGVGSENLSRLFKSDSMAWNYAPQVTMPIFDPRVWSALKVTKVDRATAVTQYERAIQSAFREVADTLAVRGTVDQQIAAQESLVHASSETFRLATARYVKGVDSYLSVLDAQQAMYAAQQRLVTLRLAKLANQVELFAVLGGGWQ